MRCKNMYKFIHSQISNSISRHKVIKNINIKLD